MVIKGSAAKRDEEKLHPGADVEQEGKKEKEEMEGRDWGVQGQGQKKRKQQRKGKNESERTEREREREIRMVWIATGNERLEREGHNDFGCTLHCCVEAHAIRMEMRLMLC